MLQVNCPGTTRRLLLVIHMQRYQYIAEDKPGFIIIVTNMRRYQHIAKYQH